MIKRLYKERFYREICTKDQNHIKLRGKKCSEIRFTKDKMPIFQVGYSDEKGNLKFSKILERGQSLTHCVFDSLF